MRAPLLTLGRVLLWTYLFNLIFLIKYNTKWKNCRDQNWRTWNLLKYEAIISKLVVKSLIYGYEYENTCYLLSLLSMLIVQVNSQYNSILGRISIIWISCCTVNKWSVQIWVSNVFTIISLLIVLDDQNLHHVVS